MTGEPDANSSGILVLAAPTAPAVRHLLSFGSSSSNPRDTRPCGMELDFRQQHLPGFLAFSEASVHFKAKPGKKPCL